MATTKNRISKAMLATVTAVGLAVGVAGPAAAANPTDIFFIDQNCGHYGYASKSLSTGVVTAYTMPTSSPTACKYNGTATHIAGIAGNYTWGNGVIYSYGSSSANGGKHSGGSVYKTTYLS